MAKQALVLCDCIVGESFRKAGEVVEINESEAVNYAGLLDLNPSAVRYALHGEIVNVPAPVEVPAVEADEPANPEPVADAPKRGRPKKSP